MFENLGGWEILALILVALFIIGPDRLPKVLSDGLGMLRKLRNMARSATSDLSRELGTNIELEDLHPKTFLRKHLLSEAEEEALRKPFQDVISDVKGTAETLSKEAEAVSKEANALRDNPNRIDLDKLASGNGAAGPAATPAATPEQPTRRSYDDAT